MDDVRFVGEGKHLAIATTVTVGNEVISRTVRIKGEDTTHFLLTVAVGSEEMARETAVDDLYLSADNSKGGEKRLHPVVDAGTDDEHLGTFCLCLFQQTNHLWPQQMARAVGEVLAKAIELVDGHPLEEPREHALFRLSIIIEPQLHQHQQRGMEQEAQYETGCATGKADKLNQSVAGGEGAVEVASV